MAIASPSILLPSVGPEIRTNVSGFLISGTTDSVTTAIKYTYAILPEGSGSTPVYSAFSVAGVSFTPATSPSVTTLPWSIDTTAFPSFTTGSVLYLKVYAEDTLLSETSLPADYVAHSVYYTDVAISAPVPTGVSAARSNVSISIAVDEIPDVTYVGSFIGFNYYVSLSSGGGAAGYQKMNKDYVNTPARVDTTLIPQGTTTSITGDLSVETKVTTIAQTPKYVFEFTKDVLTEMVSTGKLANIRYTDSTSFYFVVTSTVFDTNTGMSVESLYSVELLSRFLTFIPNFSEMPPRNHDDVMQSFATRMQTINNKANLVAGSVYRDILDPVAEEMASAYVVQDFLSRSQSIDGLIQFDDADGDGVSDPVSTSVLKKRLQVAMGVSNDTVLQNIIDSSFDKLASNFNVVRLPPTYATGKIIFYVLTVPSEGLYINDGAVLLSRDSSGNALRFVVQGSKYLFYAEKDRYYNTVAGRYEVLCDIKAATTGTSSNVGSGTITTVGSGADTRWKVTNSSPMFGGTTTESNISLANRFKIALSGLDTGTEGGYLMTSLSVSGVRFATVIQGGDSIMRRDVDSTSGQHMGGKVDIYVQGDLVAQDQEVYGFTYGGPSGGQTSGERFYVEDADSFLFRTDNPAVTAATPIFDLRRVTNLTRGASYDIAGAVLGLGDGDSISLAHNSTNLSIGLATLDVIEIDYHYRGYNSYTMSNQPVSEIVSVTGDIDGVLPTENYRLVKLEDPLLNGNSTIAKDGVEIMFSRGLPSNVLNTISNEQHVMMSSKEESLVKKGVDTDTIVVAADPVQTLVYVRDLDYKVIKGGDTGYTYIALTSASRIRTGTLVYISYNASQNFTVVYTYNKLLADVQNAVNVKKHAAADVIVKQAVGNDVSISVKVIRKNGYSEASVVNSISNNISSMVQNLKLGTGFNLDDMVNIVKNTEGVRTVQLPPYRMMKANGSFIPNDEIGLVDFQVYNQNSGKGVTSYLSVNPVLSYGTTEGGGESTLFRTIYEDGTPLVLAGSALEVSQAKGRGYIRSDGRIVVSTSDGMPPQTKEYRAAYYTYVSSSSEFAADITVDSMEYLTIGPNSVHVDASVEEPLNRSR